MRKALYTSILILFCIATIYAQKPKEPLAHTFSVVGRDNKTGEMGVAVQSHWFSVGTSVSWGKSGVGVVATQSFVLPAYGPKGLLLMEQGIPADQALKILLDQDEGEGVRQVAFLDKNGIVGSHTGENCIQDAGHLNGANFSVQANMMLNKLVVPAMEKAFKENENLPLAERLVAVLQAAQDAGGDIRGKQSAALIVVGPDKVVNSWEDHKIDLRVDDHKNPIQELGRLLKVHRAFAHMNAGDIAVEYGNMETALTEYAAAEKLFPENLEMKYWKAIALANNNRLDEALPIFKYVFKEDKNWIELTKRLPDVNLLNLSEKDMNRILNQ